MKVIRCDCGFEVSEHDEGNLVGRAQKHARDVHHMDLPAELVPAVVGANTRTQRSGPVEPGPQQASLRP